MKKKNNVKMGFTEIIVLVLIFGLFLGFCVNIAKYPEEYSSVMKYQLMLDLNDHNADAVEYYHDRYISRGKVLYNGDVSFDMICYEMCMDKEKTREQWEVMKELDSKYNSLQKFVNDFMK